LTEPVLAFRLDVGAANVHAQKRYTLLLDPNGYAVEEHAAIVAIPTSRCIARKMQPLKVYRVPHGDTLSLIASRMKGGNRPLPDGCTRAIRMLSSPVMSIACVPGRH
jgi:pilus assembly protein FimV